MYGIMRDKRRYVVSFLLLSACVFLTFVFSLAVSVTDTAFKETVRSILSDPNDHVGHDGGFGLAVASVRSALQADLITE